MPRLFLAPVFAVAALLTMSSEAKQEPSPADYARAQIENLPEDDIWWTKNGLKMVKPCFGALKIYIQFFQQ
ncbi:MAG: hypothetical protein CMQ59_03700 [Gammaproteobacteria bacterium]|nr:hypothetical protein [Gammaproteobacteria bacterium]